MTDRSRCSITLGLELLLLIAFGAAEFADLMAALILGGFERLRGAAGVPAR